MSTTARRCARRLLKITRMDLPSRSPPPKKAMLSACVRSRVCTFRKAPSKKYSCSIKAFHDVLFCPGACNCIAEKAAFPEGVGCQTHFAQEAAQRRAQVGQVFRIPQQTLQVCLALGRVEVNCPGLCPKVWGVCQEQQRVQDGIQMQDGHTLVGLSPLPGAQKGAAQLRGAHILGEGPKVRGDCGERPEAQEGVQVQDGHAAAARQLVELHAEPGDVHHRLDHGGDQGCQVIAQPLHIPCQPLVHILAKQRPVSDAALRRSRVIVHHVLQALPCLLRKVCSQCAPCG